MTFDDVQELVGLCGLGTSFWYSFSMSFLDVILAVSLGAYTKGVKSIFCARDFSMYNRIAFDDV